MNVAKTSNYSLLEGSGMAAEASTEATMRLIHQACDASTRRGVATPHKKSTEIGPQPIGGMQKFQTYGKSV